MQLTLQSSPAGSGGNYLHGTSLKWHPSLASSPTSLSCFPHSHTGAPWEYFLNQLLACKSLSWGLLLENPTKDTIKKKRKNRLNGHLWEELAILISWDSKSDGKWRPLNPKTAQRQHITFRHKSLLGGTDLVPVVHRL